MKKDGLIPRSMIHTLSALQNNKDILLNTLDVFVKEPLVDWLKNAKKQKFNNDDDEEETDKINWYPMKKN